MDAPNLRAVLPMLALVIAVLAQGCVGSGGAQQEAAAPHPGESVAPIAPETSPAPLPSGLGLTFARDASDVMNTDTKPFEIPLFDFTNATTPDGRLVVNYFMSARCSACAALRPEIDRLEAEYSSVDWREFDITTQNGTWAYQQFADGRNLSDKERLVPQVLVNDTVITDRFNINRSLEGVIIAFNARQS
jgi:hypothetical protein